MFLVLKVQMGTRAVRLCDKYMCSDSFFEPVVPCGQQFNFMLTRAVFIFSK